MPLILGLSATLREQPNNQTTFNQTTFNLQPNNLQPSTKQPSTLIMSSNFFSTKEKFFDLWAPNYDILFTTVFYKNLGNRAPSL
ncbi:hypothetical protein [Moorena sp. SIOASIH]|uniref:hypothetical protein n=1 Tax=Moorena sp. SIOASIH TaxID=2607817 RepID=UPI0025F23502|nr:hypothetical protein [Moorena sp. SIOASIH]